MNPYLPPLKVILFSAHLRKTFNQIPGITKLEMTAHLIEFIIRSLFGREVIVGRKRDNYA